MTQIEIIDQNDKNLQEKISMAKQMIKQLQITSKEIKDSHKIARFESEKTQRVDKETKSSHLGLTSNSAPAEKQQIAKKIELNNKLKNELKEDGELPEFARAKYNKPQIASEQNSAVSSILPNDIDESNATNLNTDANTYYSFYNRVEELFYVRWVERVRYYWDRIGQDYKKNVLAGKIWPTTLEIWLTSNGEFHSAYIKQPSGYKPFDEAAVFAFKDARFFPNPPRAKVEPDGFVRLRYRFNVHVGEN